MADVEKYANELKELVMIAEDFRNKIINSMGGSFKWSIEQVVSSYLSMFDRFCPYKIGDRVKLVKDVEINDSNSGWAHCQHFLKKGAKATVKDRGYTDGHFSFSIEFDDESWIDSEGEIRPIELCRRHVFGFAEGWICKINAEPVCNAEHDSGCWLKETNGQGVKIMHSNYYDIISRIEKEPEWYDSNGTPRYDTFHPDLCPNIYSHAVGLFEITCQNCGKSFKVEMHVDIFGDRRIESPPNTWHYGDPPIHDCIGDTMNCIDVRVLEFWTKSYRTMKWKRQKQFEVEM